MSCRALSMLEMFVGFFGYVTDVQEALMLQLLFRHFYTSSLSFLQEACSDILTVVPFISSRELV